MQQKSQDLLRAWASRTCSRGRAIARSGSMSRPRCATLTHVSRLDVGSTIAATSLGLTTAAATTSCCRAITTARSCAIGPGRAHLHELLRHAIEHGIRDFDFTIGDEPYKRDWADVEVRLHDHLQAATLRGAVVVAMIHAFRRTKRFDQDRRPCCGAPIARPASSPGSCAGAEPLPAPVTPRRLIRAAMGATVSATIRGMAPTSSTWGRRGDLPGRAACAGRC